LSEKWGIKNIYTFGLFRRLQDLIVNIFGKKDVIDNRKRH